MKPLDETGGGYFHRGATLFGKGNVFLTRDDDDYKLLQKWAHGTRWQDDPKCAAMFATPDAGTEDAGL
jgi:hypothetical protein